MGDVVKLLKAVFSVEMNDLNIVATLITGFISNAVRSHSKLNLLPNLFSVFEAEGV